MNPLFVLGSMASNAAEIAVNTGFAALGIDLPLLELPADPAPTPKPPPCCDDPGCVVCSSPTAN